LSKNKELRRQQYIRPNESNNGKICRRILGHRNPGTYSALETLSQVPAFSSHFFNRTETSVKVIGVIPMHDSQ